MVTEDKYLVVLGASENQVPLIHIAKELGLNVITIDNRPKNPGHKLADIIYDNISITDHENILNALESYNPLAVCSTASDLGSRACAYLQEKLDLPGPSTQGVNLLSNKYTFRKTCREAEIPYPPFSVIRKKDQLPSNLVFPVVVKPVDRSGSIGVSMVYEIASLAKAVDRAISVSISGVAILESKITKKGKQVCGDVFVENGKVSFCQYGDGHFPNEKRGLAPYGETFPSDHDESILDEVTNQINKLVKVANYNAGPLNIDAIVDQDGKVYLIDIGTRLGGNFIPDAIKLQTNINLYKHYLNLCLGYKSTILNDYNKSKFYHASYMINKVNCSQSNIDFLTSNQIDKYIKLKRKFSHNFIESKCSIGMTYSLGNVIMEFPDRKTMNNIISKMQSYITFIKS